jgi:hypothetical protein
MTISMAIHLVCGGRAEFLNFPCSLRACLVISWIFCWAERLDKA